MTGALLCLLTLPIVSALLELEELFFPGFVYLGILCDVCVGVYIMQLTVFKLSEASAAA